MGQYWVRRGQELFGPMASHELKASARSGQVVPTDEVSPDQQRWVPAGKVTGLVFSGPSHSIESVLKDWPAPVKAAAEAFAPMSAPSVGLTAQVTLTSAAASGLGAISLKVKVIVAAVLVLLLAGGTTAWFMRGGSARQAMDLAPADTAGILFIDTRAVRSDVLKLIETNRSVLGADFERARTLVEIIDWVAVYFPAGKNSDKPLIAIHANWTRSGLDAITGMNGRIGKSEGNGRYSLDKGHVILGSEASDLDDDLVLLAPPRFQANDLAGQLGKGSDALRAIAADADTSATFWLAIRFTPDAGMPFASAVASMNAHGQGEANFAFASEQDATEAMKSIQQELAGLAKTMEVATMNIQIKRDGKTLRISQTAELDLVKGISNDLLNKRE